MSTFVEKIQSNNFSIHDFNVISEWVKGFGLIWLSLRFVYLFVFSVFTIGSCNKFLYANIVIYYESGKSKSQMNNFIGFTETWIDIESAAWLQLR